MSEDPGSLPGDSNSDPASTQISRRRAPISAIRSRTARMSTGTRVFAGLLVLAMIVVGSVLIFSAILPASNQPTATLSAAPTQAATIKPSPTRVQPTATHQLPSSTHTQTPQPSATAPSTTATSEPTSTSTSAPSETPSTVPTSPPTTNDDASSDAANDLLNRINNLRSQNGLSPYRLNDALAKAAARHSQDRANSGRIDHTGSDGSNARQRIQDAGYGNWPAGEIIFGGQVTLDDAWDYWSTDPPHLASLLSKQYREMGVGIVTSGNRTYYTVDFGGHPRQ